MKDSRVTALERVLSRRKKLDKKLSMALTALRTEQGQLDDVLAARRTAVDTHRIEVDRQGKKIDAMLTTTFRADEFLILREFHATAVQQHVGLESEAEQAENAVSKKRHEIDLGKRAIVQNRARIDIYGGRRDSLCKGIELAAEEAQDEEAAESWRKPLQSIGGAR